jgi:hypothetical protein
MFGQCKQWLALAGALMVFAALSADGAQHGAQHGTGEQGHEHGHEHAGHAPAAAEAPPEASAPAPVAVPSEQPAKTLQPDALDAPAATSVVEAQRSAEMSRAMAGGHGGHGGHGVRRYRHVDAGRGAQQHDHSSADAAHSGHGEQEAAGLYVCPMHPEVTSETPGTCPKCGMALVERRKE